MPTTRRTCSSTAPPATVGSPRWAIPAREGRGHGRGLDRPTTTSAAASPTRVPSWRLPLRARSILSTQLGNSYGTSSGTSFAAPYVGALAGLIRSVNPEHERPRGTSADHGLRGRRRVSEGFDNLTGWGRINAFEAVSQVGGFADGFIGRSECRAGTPANSSLIVTVVDPDLEGRRTVFGVTAA